MPRFKINSNTINKEWNHLLDVQIQLDSSHEISVLVCAGFQCFRISQDVRIVNDNETIAILTPLGWVEKVEQITSEQIS